MFEFLILEGAQAGLSWITILRRREQYRAAFAGFDVLRVSCFTDRDIERLMRDSGIVRHRAKICSAIDNARCFLCVQEEFGSFSDYLWGFVDGAPIVNCWSNAAEVPTKTALSKCISEDMRGRGFRFFGPTICYAYLQSMGLVNDHLARCFRRAECLAVSPSD
tara:strand:+ start:2258 stop:2746 length:489 start_codon:yes stop_codon:yes gene_type:complete